MRSEEELEDSGEENTAQNKTALYQSTVMKLAPKKNTPLAPVTNIYIFGKCGSAKII